MTSLGTPVGPIRLTDEGGTGIPCTHFVGRVTQETLKNIVEAGRLRLKNQREGFFLRDGSVAGYVAIDRQTPFP
jgi:hypothetical protein